MLAVREVSPLPASGDDNIWNKSIFYFSKKKKYTQTSLYRDSGYLVSCTVFLNIVIEFTNSTVPLCEIGVQFSGKIVSIERKF